MTNTDQAAYFFHQGTNYDAYSYLGCTRTRWKDRYLYTFRTWAPGADGVCLVSDFTDWDTGMPLSRVTDRGVFELTVDSDRSLEGSAYKFRIYSRRGAVNKGDPYARYSRGGADGASIVCTESAYRFGDAGWMAHRKQAVGNAQTYLSSPMNIYEVHLGSFMRHEDGGYLNYREAADILLPYLKRMGYTHVEFLPLAEHPYDGSWGYQVCGFYAPSARFGTPDDLRYLVDTLHRGGIGVFLDWVPAHFPKDAWGLYEFDGGPLYEYQGLDRMESSSWGTRFFDLGREEVQSFLVSNALYWLREFHIDGLRVDAVASMLYLDYDRRPGEWIPNFRGGRENLEAIAFFGKLNAAVLGEFPDALMIAEESTAFPGVTAPVSAGGLGFSMKWNMGFANDFYDYLQTDPIYRKHHHSALNFPIMYAFSENYCLPISHDEVVHGKHSFVDKMFGSYEDKFRQARTALLLMMTYPGKKLMFMGTEFAQFREWTHEESLEWFMLDYPMHSAFRAYVGALNRFYLSSPPLWKYDFSERGFAWILPDEADKNAVAYRRMDGEGNSLIVLAGFGGASAELCIPLGRGESLVSVFDTGEYPAGGPAVRYGGTGEAPLAYVTLAPYSGAIFRTEKKRRRISARTNVRTNIKTNSI